jgi:hypothetical protein
MPLPEVFKDLKLDVWYRAVVYIGGVVLIFSFFFEVKGISNAQLQLLSGGFFLIGLGEWKNHKKESFIKPPNAYTGPTALVTRTVWSPDVVGALFDLIGIGLIGAFVWSIV